MKYELHIGIDYYGAKTPSSRLKRLQVFADIKNTSPVRIAPSFSSEGKKITNWTRIEIAEWILNLTEKTFPLLWE